MRIYVIGQVSGFDDLNLPAFEEARRMLTEAGYMPLIPHDFIVSDATWQQAMRRSLETIAKADGIACLPNWSKSNGARIEQWIAEKLGIPAMSVELWCSRKYAQKCIADSHATKLCPRCKRVIPLSLFDKSASSSDGRQSYCRSCMTGYRDERQACVNGFKSERRMA